MEALTVAVRFGLYLDLMALFGVAAFSIHALRGADADRGAVIPVRLIVASAAAVGLALSTFGLVAMAAAMSGVALKDVDRTSIDAVLWGTAIGTTWLCRMAALSIALACALADSGFGLLSRSLATAAGAVALCSMAWAGHGAMDEGAIGWVHLAADLAHLVAAGLWLGALVGLAMLVFRPMSRVDRTHLLKAHGALEGFSLAGSVIVGVIIVTGIVNAWLLVGPSHVGSLGDSTYGLLLIAKLVLFGAMLGLAAGNRFFLTPRLGSAIAANDYETAVLALRWSLIVETGCAVAILALVAWLGTLEPPISGA